MIYAGPACVLYVCLGDGLQGTDTEISSNPPGLSIDKAFVNNETGAPARSRTLNKQTTSKTFEKSAFFSSSLGYQTRGRILMSRFLARWLAQGSESKAKSSLVPEIRILYLLLGNPTDQLFKVKVKQIS